MYQKGEWIGMAKKRICRICGYENNANVSSCGMCGADFGLELNFEEVDNNDEEDMLSGAASNSDMSNSGSANDESQNVDSQSPDHSEWEPVYLKRMWSKGVSKLLSVIIVFAFLTGVTVYFFQTSDKMQRYRIVYKHVLEMNDGDVWKTVNQVRRMDDITLYRYAEEYSQENVKETLDTGSDAAKTKDNKEKNSKKKRNSKKKNKKTSKDKSDYIFKNSNKRYLKDKELKKLSKEKLSIARNEIYARAGRKFTTKKWKNYFKKKKWYVPKYSAKYFDRHEKKLFNKYERANVKKIKKFEKRRGR